LTVHFADDKIFHTSKLYGKFSREFPQKAWERCTSSMQKKIYVVGHSSRLARRCSMLFIVPARWSHVRGVCKRARLLKLNF